MNARSELFSVVTLSEAVRLWRLHRTTILYCIDRGLLSGRKSGRTWLLLSRELIERYGAPVVEPVPEYYLRYRSTHGRSVE